MKFKKNLMTLSVATLMGTGAILASNQPVKAANNGYIIKTVMHNAAAYDKNGKNTGKVYKSYQKVYVDSGIVNIKGNQFYKLSDKDEYLKITNIDGVERTVKHNAYVYATSTRRANGRIVKKGTTIVTYGGSYKFKNGKRYYRVGGPAKQYVKVVNLGDVINNLPTTSSSTSKPAENTNNISSNNTSNTSNTSSSADTDTKEETTVTVKYGYNVNIYNSEGKVVKKSLPKGTRLVVDKHQETVPFAGMFVPAWKLDGFYRIKGTSNWLVGVLVKPDKALPLSK